MLATTIPGALLAALVLNAQSLLPAMALHVLIDLRSLLLAPTPD